jgi:hypothetical protein
VNTVSYANRDRVEVRPSSSAADDVGNSPHGVHLLLTRPLRPEHGEDGVVQAGRLQEPRQHVLRRRRPPHVCGRPDGAGLDAHGRGSSTRKRRVLSRHQEWARRVLSLLFLQPHVDIVSDLDFGTGEFPLPGWRRTHMPEGPLLRQGLHYGLLAMGTQVRGVVASAPQRSVNGTRGGVTLDRLLGSDSQAGGEPTALDVGAAARSATSAARLGRRMNLGGACGATLASQKAKTPALVKLLLENPGLLKVPANLSAVAISRGHLMLPDAAARFAERVLLDEAAYSELLDRRYYDTLRKLREGGTQPPPAPIAPPAAPTALRVTLDDGGSLDLPAAAGNISGSSSTTALEDVEMEEASEQEEDPSPPAPPPAAAPPASSSGTPPRRRRRRGGQAGSTTPVGETPRARKKRQARERQARRREDPAVRKQHANEESTRTQAKRRADKEAKGASSRSKRSRGTRRIKGKR